MNVLIWSNHGRLSEILKQLPMKPDFILLNDFHPSYCPFIKDIKHVDIPVGCIMHDMHYKTEKRRKFIKEENIDYLFPHYRDAFLRWFPEYKKRMQWFPHHVPTHLFKDYQLDKTINFLFIGAAVPHIYPLRTKMIQKLRKQKGFVMHSHPGYRKTTFSSKRNIVAERYAQEINRAKMLFTSHSNYQYPVLKYFETAACNTLLMANGSQELIDLGFIDGKTYVEVDEKNVLEKAHYYLENEEERRNISSRAYNMVRERHSTAKRASEFVDFIKGL
ncbi:glycosyltransferase [Pueribacillus sp. YX66]|uniref:glycosyltransferase family protein n=1 Tax=Pueribacillus sp. YX66 TaxID=3229242 RepID=UPI00358D8BB0